MASQKSRWVLSMFVGGLSLMAAACQTISPWCGSQRTDECGGDPHLCRDNSMMAMARDLDHLERHIDAYGSVTARAPSVWGEARLTRYRDEIEKILETDKDKFTLILSGQVSRADQSFLASATAIGLAASPKATVAAAVPTATQAESTTQYLTPPLVASGREIVTKQYDANGKEIGSTTTREVPATPKTETPPPTPPAPVVINVPDPGDPAKLVSNIDANKIIVRNDFKLVSMPGFGGAQFADVKIGLEPVEFLNQKKRYLDYLAQLRRTNEGDDTADSPGYALNLIRVPVSVLPGKRTDTGHGAEITMTLTPDLGNELLPNTFRTLVTNDIVKQFGFPLTKFLESEENRELLADRAMRLIVRDIQKFREVVAAINDELDFRVLLEGLPPALKAELGVPELIAALCAKQKENENLDKTMKDRIGDVGSELIISYRKMALLGATSFGNIELHNDATFKRDRDAAKKADDEAKGRQRLLASFGDKLKKLDTTLNAVQVPFSTGTRGKQPVPASQFFEVHGATFPFEIGAAVSAALAAEIGNRGYVHLPDVQELLKTEIDAAYRFLALDSNRFFWDRFSTQDVAKLVLNRSHKALIDERDEFRRKFAEVANPTRDENPDHQTQFSTTAALAWALLVDSALLNHRLINDIKDVATTKNVALPAGQWLDYHTPNPSPEARKAFNDYVLARWPIRVFALDPETNDQNIADSLSVRREMQIAVSVAFASGKMKLNQFNQFVRRLEADYQTIALNRTQVGFGHGANVFGWRFYPRFQTPSTPSNLQVIVRDQLIGGPSKNALLRDQRLEPGPRECVALVIMPSFVSSATLDVNGNWFGLTNPKQKVFDHTQALHLSRTVQSIKTKGCEVVDAGKYRDVDQKLMQTRAEQLSSRLPLQTMSAQIPTSDNLAGYELFSHSTSDLAPQLYGWYGAPGVAEGKETHLFLVGDHFSVTQSRILTGNKLARHAMISRQVMAITVPHDAMARTTDGKVQINVATPYGVSQDLLVPRIAAKEVCKNDTNLPSTVEVVVERLCEGPSKCRIIDATIADAKAVAWLKLPDDKLSGVKVNISLTFPLKGCELVVDQTCLGKSAEITPYGQMVPLDSAVLQKIVGCLLGGLNTCGDCASIDDLIAKGITTTSIKIATPDGKIVKDSVNQLTLTFKCRNRAGACPPGGDCPPVDQPMQKGEQKNVAPPMHIPHQAVPQQLPALSSSREAPVSNQSNASNVVLFPLPSVERNEPLLSNAQKER